MGSVLPDAHWLLLASLIPLALGVLLFRLGYRPPRRGDTPYCRKCDYNLTGLTSGVCPECGTMLSDGAIVRGEPRRRRSPFVAALVLSLMAGVLWFGAARQVNWYRLRPTGWVIDDVESGNALLARKAWIEITRRSQAGKLSGAKSDRLVKICLAEQTRKTPGTLGTEMLNHLARCYLNDKLPKQQTDTFFSQMCRWSLAIRPKVICGDLVPYTIQEHSRAPSVLTAIDGAVVGYRLWQERAEKIVIDGKPLARAGARGAGTLGASGNSSWGRWFSFDQPGKHEVEIHMKIRIGKHDEGERGVGEVFYEEDRILTGRFEILAAGGGGDVKLVKDPTHREEIRSSIRPERFTYGSFAKDTLAGDVKVSALPVNVAFEVFARIAGREHPLGTIGKKSGTSTSFLVEGKLPGFVGESCDIILRGSPELARRSVDLFEIWDGELTYKDVPVENHRAPKK